MDASSLPAGWQCWHEERDGRVILAYRPDVFDSEAFPAPCLPTIYVTSGTPRRRPGSNSTDGWQITLFLEPEIEAVSESYEDRAAAIDGAIEHAERFAAGEIDYRALYQVPREAYFDRLDELVGESEA
ncbi:DUF5820 family protein [Halonotius roseus]|uniref:Uncharacterized protein n=1 Tax=Halonotius roseus TaxID=2511997 RepID=A0A544QRN4_9EURY|nr:DUF5820 family protein [Halonotius roseus]TQQ82113.1 hypothetical protein EWF95_04005 [Halonotius roseus]